MKHENKITIVIGMGLLLVMGVLTFTPPSRDQASFTTPVITPSSPHDTISISQDSDFWLYASQGDGNMTTPFIIKNLEIFMNNTDHVGLSIKDTTAYFKLENLIIRINATVPMPGFYKGIYLDNVTNGVINETIVHTLLPRNFDTTGMEMNNCSRIRVLNCTIFDNSIGMNLTECQAINVENTIFRNNHWGNPNPGGIFATYCVDVHVIGCTFESNSIGVQLFHVNQSEIVGSSFTNNSRQAVDMQSCMNNSVSGNTMVRNGWIGGVSENPDVSLSISGSPSGNHQVRNNSITKTLTSAIRIMYSIADTVAGNVIFNNSMTRAWNAQVELQATNWIVFEHNTVHMAVSSGVSLALVLNATVRYNNVSRNAEYGITLANTNSTKAHGNQVESNGKAGIAIFDSTSRWNVFSYNIIGDNDLAFGVQAIDESGFNAWDDGSRGNYWGDYTARYPNAKALPNFTWDTPYAINNTSALDVKDNHPLGAPWQPQSEIPGYDALVIGIVTCMAMLGMVILSKKQTRA